MTTVFFTHPACLEHDTGQGHPERPQRLEAVLLALDEPEFSLTSGPANVLPFNRTLIAARFRCNIQEETGVSCVSEQSGNGFTFSADGFAPQYTEVPVDAP